MMSVTQLRAARTLPRQLRTLQRSLATTARQLDSKAVAPTTNETTPEVPSGATPTDIAQAPNRTGIWSRSQKPRSQAMTGPRFEQTDYELQVRLREELPLDPWAGAEAYELTS